MPAYILNCVLIGLTLLLLGGCQILSAPGTEKSHHAIPLNYLPALKGDYFTFQSQAVERTFHIYVRFPEGYSENADQYPVVYLLDGDSLFPILAANHLFLTYDESLAEAIVVGIAYGSFDPAVNKRGFDFSAAAPDASPEQGGATSFHDFLEFELMPEIESRYRADTGKQILFGQSRGGYMVLYSAFTRPDLFWGRIASNPTFDPGRDRFFSQPVAATREDLGLVVTSGAQDWPGLRAAALEWRDEWKGVENLPWDLKFITIDEGTHAARSPDSYREAMLWLFSREQK